jgi:hypothetical protein
MNAGIRDRCLTAAACGILLCLQVSPAVADCYKWVDDQGTTHYGDKPPAAQRAERIPMGKAGGGISEYSQDRLEQMRAFLRECEERDRRATEKRRRTEQERQQERERQAKCLEARRQRRFQDEVWGMRMPMPGPEGELTWMTGENRTREKEHWDEQIKIWCK